MIVEIQSRKEVLPMTYGTSYSTKELQELLTKMMFIKAQGSEIQKKYNFTIHRIYFLSTL